MEKTEEILKKIIEGVKANDLERVQKNINKILKESKKQIREHGN